MNSDHASEREGLSQAVMVAPRAVAIGREVDALSGLSGPQLATLRQRLVRHARFAVGSDALADDLVQETLIAVVERLAQYRGDATLITWAVAILKHKVADWYRSPVRARTTQIYAEQDELEGHPTHDADGGLLGAAPSSQEPANLLENREMMSALGRCVGAMPPQTAHVFLMHDWQGYKTAEICDRLEVRADNVRTMLSRARKVVRDCMVHDWVDCKGRRRAQDEHIDRVEARTRPSHRRLTPYRSTEID